MKVIQRALFKGQKPAWDYSWRAAAACFVFPLIGLDVEAVKIERWEPNSDVNEDWKTPVAHVRRESC